MSKFFYCIGSAIAGFFAPIQMLIVWTAVFVLIDLVSGVWAAKKRGELLTSRKLRKTIDKIAWFSLAIVLAFILDVKILTFAALYLANGTAGLCCGTELYSIFENAYQITGNNVFWMLTQFTNKKITDATGTDIKKEVAECQKRSGRKSQKCKQL